MNYPNKLLEWYQSNKLDSFQAPILIRTLSKVLFSLDTILTCFGLTNGYVYIIINTVTLDSNIAYSYPGNIIKSLCFKLLYQGFTEEFSKDVMKYGVDSFVVVCLHEVNPHGKTPKEVIKELKENKNLWVENLKPTYNASASASVSL